MSGSSSSTLKFLALSCFALPGVVFHELGHLLFCKLTGAKVYSVVYFRFGNPAGYVVHATPRHFRDHFAIVVGPFILNSITSFLLFLSVLAPIRTVPNVSELAEWARSDLIGGADPQLVALSATALWLGISVALQAFPSKGDAKSLWQVTGRHVRRGNILAIVGYPVVGIIYLVNILRRLGLDWIYAGALLVLAAVKF